MMCKLLSILLPFVFFMSCKDRGNENDTPRALQMGADSSLSFSVIEKDSVYAVNYRLHKQELANGIIVFTYSGSSNDFVLWCDTARKIYKECTRSDTTAWELETQKFYEVNGKSFQVLKLASNKNATDGEMLYFLDPEIGLLISKSVTWRLGEIINPDKDHKDYLQLTALLFRILTDEENFKREAPVNKIKFTIPKLE